MTRLLAYLRAIWKRYNNWCGPEPEDWGWW